MLVRAASIVAPFLVWGLTLGCGTSTTVTGPVDDAGCPMVVLDGGRVVEPPEGGVADCPSGVCNYQSQAGCPAGQACRPQFSATSTDVAPGCEPAGTGKSGTVCKVGSDCAAGYFCVLDSAGAGACHKQCCGGDWLACDPGESCIRQSQVKVDGAVVDGGMIVDTGMEFCFPVNDCDPLDPKPCPSDPTRECKIVDPTGAVACEPLGNGHAGDACDAPSSAASSCAAGLYCVGEECRKLCRAEACGEPACAATDTCVHFNRDPAGVGECTPP